MGYAAEYHVERYMRECFVPRIAPVSRVSNFLSLSDHVNGFADGHTTGDDHELRWREGVEAAAKLLDNLRRYTTFVIKIQIGRVIERIIRICTLSSTPNDLSRCTTARSGKIAS